jgi:uncharacterized membrane protein YoaK (UPF0700 family)
MARNSHARIALAIALIAVAGCVDAIGYLRLGHLFVSFMSGDSTRLAVATVRGNWGAATAAGTIVALFVAGVVAGRLIRAALASRGRPGVLAMEALLLAVAALLRTPIAAVIALTVVAMGVQNAAIDREHAAGMGLSYVTGTLVSFGDKLADAIRGGRERRWAWAPSLLHWCGLALGAIFGALAYRAWGMSALLVPAGAAAMLAAVTAVA